MSEIEVWKSDYKTQAAKAIAVMLATLDNYGKKPTGDLIDGWMMALKSRRFPIEHIQPTTAWFCEHGSKFPTPAEFMDQGFELSERAKIRQQLAWTMEEAKIESDAKSAQLLEKYPDIDREFVKSLFGSACRALTERTPADPEIARVESELAKATELGLTPKQLAERGS